MNMNTCDTCKWWGMEQYRHVFDGDDFKLCGNTKVNEWKGSNTDPDTVCLHKSIDTSIITGPKFGCIHWEAK